MTVSRPGTSVGRPATVEPNATSVTPRTRDSVRDNAAEMTVLSVTPALLASARSDSDAATPRSTSIRRGARGVDPTARGATSAGSV